MDIVMSAATNAAGLAKAASLNSRAFVTFLAGNGDYVKGVIGLAKGLRKVRTAYPLVVAVLPDVPEEHRRMLVAQGCIIREIEPVYPPRTRPSSPWLTTSSTTPSSASGRDIYKPIASVYNLVLAMLWRHPENIEVEKVKVVHYCAAGSKPWRYTGKEEHMEREDIKMLVKKWWDIYNDVSLDYRRTESEADRLMAALSKAGAVKYVTAPSAA
ncbi:unnamed protein product [Thlaspi arvense]|uniref:Hexosyltransferase n=1 Tax=Thlaspi arvense TaxID=13288 RepID=A0AAU9RJG3_THLAR|nr:unnamed protein product [Thlaspi arvense]